MPSHPNQGSPSAMRVCVHFQADAYPAVNVSVGAGTQTFKWLALAACRRAKSLVILGGVCGSSRSLCFDLVPAVWQAGSTCPDLVIDRVDVKSGTLVRCCITAPYRTLA